MPFFASDISQQKPKTKNYENGSNGSKISSGKIMKFSCNHENMTTNNRTFGKSRIQPKKI